MSRVLRARDWRGTCTRAAVGGAADGDLRQLVGELTRTVSFSPPLVLVDRLARSSSAPLSVTVGRGRAPRCRRPRSLAERRRARIWNGSSGWDRMGIAGHVDQRARPRAPRHRERRRDPRSGRRRRGNEWGVVSLGPRSSATRPSCMRRTAELAHPVRCSARRPARARRSRSLDGAHRLGAWAAEARSGRLARA